MKTLGESVSAIRRASLTAVALFCLLTVAVFTVPSEAQRDTRRSGVKKADTPKIISPAKQARIDFDRESANDLSSGYFTPVVPAGLAPNADPTFWAYDFFSDRIVSFTASDPGTFNEILTVTGLDAATDERLEFIDFRPANGTLYGIARKTSTNFCRVVTITLNTVNDTAAVTSAGADVACGTDALFYGGDFNPVVDLIREVDRNEGNRRWSPAGGAPTNDGALAYAAGDPNAGISPDVVHAAYSNNFAGAPSTTLYALDQVQNTLVTIGSPGGSPVSPNTGQMFTVGNTGVNFTNFGGFDIQTGTGLAYAALTVNGLQRLYSIDLATGAATLLGLIGNGEDVIVIDGLAVAPGGATAGLSITKTDGFPNYAPGSIARYVITATNAGPDPVVGATVSDIFSAQFSSVTWTCTGSNGGTCPASGTGNINALVNLPVGGSVTFRTEAIVSQGATGQLVNTATITAPAGVTNSTPGNASSTDTNIMTTAADAIVSGRVMSPDGRGLRGALVTMVDSRGMARTVPTSTLGYYTFSEVETGESYVIGVSSRRYRFNSRIVQVSDSLTDVDFMGIE